ncbi:MAG: glycoside hydrolase family 3 N-terminal domain-containing protein [Saprospiraceae bacterium]
MHRVRDKAAYIYIYIILFGISVISAYGQSYLEREDQWVQATMEQMSLDQKVGQLFMVRAYSRGNVAEERIITEYISKYHIGGICFFQGSPAQQVTLINKYQQLSRIPLFMAIDGEWGLAMRFPKETASFPKQLMLGAIQDNKLIYEMGREVAKQCKKAGININFAPSVDINNNPSNPVIYDRSFGEIPQNVTAKGYMYMKALEDEGVMSCVKHFPGHGDTDVDSHHDLPTLSHDLQRLETTEFYPFRRLASQGVGAMMVGHLHVPALDDRPNRPTTLSQRVVKEILRNDMGFNGLIFTDAMDMKGVTKYFPNGTAEAEAFLAGNDVILLPENLAVAIATLKKYIQSGIITEKRLNQSISRILRAKYKLGLNVIPYNSPEGLHEYLYRNQAQAIRQKLAEAAVTLVADNHNVIPIKKLDGLKLATLSINTTSKTVFQSRVENYIYARHYFLMPQQINQSYTQHLNTLSQFDQVLLSIHTSGKLNDFTKDVPEDVIRFIKELSTKTEVVIILFGNPYLLSKLSFGDEVLICYDNDSSTQDVAAQSIFGVNDITGRLPVSVSDIWPAGHGISRKSLMRLGYSLPEMVGMSSDSLRKIDTIMAELIRLNASPGGQVLVAKDGKIVHQKAYGKLSQGGYYVNDNTIYDVASITKILATTISTMRLMDERKLNVNNPLRNYISGLDTTNKALLLVKDVMAHHAHLLPWIGFYKNTTAPPKSYGYNSTYYSGLLQDRYTVPVAQGMFMRSDYIDTIFQEIYTSRLRDSDTYRYSDLGFYLMQKVVEGQSGMTLDQYAKSYFYQPLGLRVTGFRPLLEHSAANIAPSEVDNYFRFQTLQGNVHDMGAAMLGGVAGHAGLFSNAKEMAILMQMLLNQGYYGGVQYIKPETIQLFTTRHAKSTRRGLGFDMKELNLSKNKSMSDLAPSSTFGHTGFTGSAVWADPKNNIVYIFCANRTYPSGNNQTLINRDFRSKIQSVIYQSIAGYEKNYFL